MSRPIQFVIEHLEEDDAESKEVPAWVGLEYTHMLTLSPPESTVHFTSLSPSSRLALASAFAPAPQSTPTLATAAAHTSDVLTLIKDMNIDISRVCLLDPKAEKELAPEDGEEFDVFLFGGILGDDPPLDRTSVLRLKGFPGRRLGPVQMTTDTALGVVKMVVVDKIPLEKIEYNEFPTIHFNAHESVEMPFRYIKGPDGEPLLPVGMRDHLKKDLDRSFEF
ncbi:DUF431-domain-containing protein [Mrakia frigida]|uniref:protein-arginine N-methyltransferase SFM1 n=1 Tax=Mrakia frigida TaxID=29902 RepID=UPI003FCBF51E